MKLEDIQAWMNDKDTKRVAQIAGQKMANGDGGCQTPEQACRQTFKMRRTEPTTEQLVAETVMVIISYWSCINILCKKQTENHFVVPKALFLVFRAFIMVGSFFDIVFIQDKEDRMPKTFLPIKDPKQTSLYISGESLEKLKTRATKNVRTISKEIVSIVEEVLRRDEEATH